MGDWFLFSLLVALGAALVAFGWLLKEPSEKPKRDAPLFTDQHVDARRRELARWQDKAAKGFDRTRPGWRFEDPPRPKK